MCDRTDGLLTALLLALGSLLPAAQAADRLDDALKRHAGTILETLEARGYRNIGVLKFQVNLPGQKAALDPYEVGRAGEVMASRLEHVLVGGLPRGSKLGIIANASGAAFASDSKAGLRNGEARRRLFDVVYPLRWGNARVRADVFLTGIVHVGMEPAEAGAGGRNWQVDPGKYTVVIQAFDRKRPDTSFEVLSADDATDFIVPTDRMLLVDIGRGFKAWNGSKSTADRQARNAFASRLVLVDRLSSLSRGAADRRAVDPNRPVTVSIEYNGKPQQLKSRNVTAGDNRYETVAIPKEGDSVSITVRNNRRKKIGVVVTVNGISTLGEEREDTPLNMGRWILGGRKKITLRGFYEKNSYKPFTVVAPDTFRAHRHGDLAPSGKLGLIAVHVLEEGEAGRGEYAAERRDGGKGFRSAPPGRRDERSRIPGATRKPATPAEARDLVNRHVGSRPQGRNYIAAGATAKLERIGDDQLPNPVHTESVIITYLSVHRASTAHNRYNPRPDRVAAALQ